MKISVNRILGGLLIAGVLPVVVGCGQGFKTNTSSNDTIEQKQVNIKKQLKAAEEATLEAQDAMAMAQAAIGAMTDARGNIKIGLFTRGALSNIGGGNLLSGISEQLRPLFDNVYNKLAEVKAKYGEARLALTDALGNLDASNPAHAAIIAQLQTQIAQLDKLEAVYSTTLHKLAGKLDLVVAGLDKLIQGVTTFIPGLGPIASFLVDWFVMGDVKALIYEFQQKLLAL